MGGVGPEPHGVEWIEVRNARFRVERQGTGGPLLFLGGSFHDLDHDRHGFRLADRHRVVMYDQRGVGRTVPPPDDAPWTMQTYADDALAVMKALGHERFALVGYSFGAMVAQHVASAAPDRIGRLALIAAGPGGPLHSHPIHEWSHLPQREAARRMLALQDTRDRNPTAKRIEEAAARTASRFALAPPGGPDRLLVARAGHDARDALGSIRAPALVIGGRHDGQARPAIVRALADTIPNADLVMIDGGHGFLADDPGPLGIIIEQWGDA